MADLKARMEAGRPWLKSKADQAAVLLAMVWLCQKTRILSPSCCKQKMHQRHMVRKRMGLARIIH